MDSKEKDEIEGGSQPGQIAWLPAILLLFVAGVLAFSVFFSSKKDAIPLPEESWQKETGDEVIDAFVPTGIKLPTIAVDASVEGVGVDKKGNMAVPSELMTVGWYELGYKPGEKGRAALTGHVNSKFGLPTVFRNLEKLEIGDEFVLTGEAGEEMTFVVTEKNVYDFRNAPLEKVFGPADVPSVSLITCDDGEWLKSEGTYKDRLVVTGVLKSAIENDETDTDEEA